MKTFLKSLLCSVSAIALFVFCAGDMEFETYYGRSYYKSLFAPEVAKEKKLEPFFRAPFNAYYGDEAREQGFYEQNIRDWYAFFDEKVDTAAIRQVLYKTPVTDLDTLIFYTKNPATKISPQLAANPLLRYDNKAKTLDFLFYLGYALRCEEFANNPNNDWDYQPRSFKGNETLQKLIKGGIRQAGNVTDPMVKERYLFQVCRLHYFNEDYAACESFFTENKSQFVAESDTYYRAMGYVAAALYKRREFAKANYNYALIFQNCELMEEDALWSFHPQEETDFKQSLAMAKTKDEKATLYFLMGYYNDPLRALKGVAAVDITSDYLPVLLTRAVNIEEENVISDFYDAPTPLDLAATKPNADLMKTVQELAVAENNPDKLLFQLAAGYLYTLAKDFAKAEKALAAAEKLTTDSLVTKSIAIYRAINAVQQKTTLNTATENELLPSFLTLLTPDSTTYLRKELATSWLKLRMAGMYKQQGDDFKAECWQVNTTPLYYEDLRNVDNFLTFLQSENKTPYEELLAGIYGYSEDELMRDKMVMQTYGGQLKEAIATLQQTENQGDVALLGDPFLIHINDCHDCDHAALQIKKYTEMSLLESMADKLKAAENATDKAQKAGLWFAVANAYYNLTHFGNARTFYTMNRLSDDYFVSLDYINYENDADKAMLKSKIFDMQQAKKYYQKARETTDDAEFKATCTFMLAKCEQNEFYLNKPPQYKGDFKAGNYFAELKNNYANTQYYKEIIRECGYFVTYLGKK